MKHNQDAAARRNSYTGKATRAASGNTRDRGAFIITAAGGTLVVTT